MEHRHRQAWSIFADMHPGFHLLGDVVNQGFGAHDYEWFTVEICQYSCEQFPSMNCQALPVGSLIYCVKCRQNVFVVVKEILSNGLGPTSSANFHKIKNRMRGRGPESTEPLERGSQRACWQCGSLETLNGPLTVMVPK